MTKNASSRKSLALAIGVTCFVSIVLNSSDLWVNMYALSPNGNTKIFDITFILFLPMILALSLTVLSLLGLLFKATRPLMGFIAVFSLPYVAAGIVIIIISNHIIHSIRYTAFEELAERSGPLIKAIQSYEHTYGNPPDTLEQLVPKFISEIPQTGMGSCLNYGYLSGEDAIRWDGNPWVIFIKAPRGPLDCDTFMYLPLQNYPEKGHGGTIEKINDWAYVHES